MKTETIEDTINQINNLETQLASVRAQMKKLGNDLMSKSTSEHAMTAGEPRNLSKSFAPMMADQGERCDKVNQSACVDSSSLSLEDWKRRAETFEKRSNDIEKQLNQTRSNYGKDVTDLEKKIFDLENSVKVNKNLTEAAIDSGNVIHKRCKELEEKNRNLEREAEEWSTTAGAMRLKVGELEEKIKVIRSNKEAIETKKKELGHKLHLAVMLINKIINANWTYNDGELTAIKDQSKKFIEEHIRPKKEESFFEKSIREAKDKMRKDIDALNKSAEKECNCFRCQAKRNGAKFGAPDKELLKMFEEVFGKGNVFIHDLRSGSN